MKKTLFVTLISILLNGVFCYGQTDLAKAKDESNAEKFSNRSGVLIQKTFEDVGTIKKCEIQVARFQDLISNQKTNGIRFEYEYKSSYSSDTKLALLDADEIEGLIKSIKIIQEKILPNSSTNYTEVSFRSRSGFEAGCFTNKGSWSTYIKLEKYDSNSYIFMDKDDLGQLLLLLQQAQSKL